MHWRRDRTPSPETQSKEISRLGQAMRFQSTVHFPRTGSCLIAFAARRKPKRLSCRWAASVALAKPRCARGTRAKSARPTAAVTVAISTFEIEVLSRAPGGIGFTTADFTELPESKIQRDNSPSELGSFYMDRGCSPALPLVRTAYHLSDACMTKCVGYSII